MQVQLISYKRYYGDYLSIPEGTGSCRYLFYEIPGNWLAKGYPNVPSMVIVEVWKKIFDFMSPKIYLYISQNYWWIYAFNSPLNCIIVFTRHKNDTIISYVFAKNKLYRVEFGLIKKAVKLKLTYELLTSLTVKYKGKVTDR